jgi:hypothetical protein
VSLDEDALAEIVVQTVDLALAPILERLAAIDARVQVYRELATKHLGANEPDMTADDLSASVTGLLRKELDDLRVPAATTTRKVIEKSATGFIVTEESTTA